MSTDDSSVNSEFFLACYNGDLDKVKYIIENKLVEDYNELEPRKTFRIDSKSKKFTDGKYTPFSIACKYNRIDVVKYLININDIDINKHVIDDHSEVLPVAIVTALEYIELFNLFVTSNKIDINSPLSPEINTMKAIHMIAYLGNDEMLDILFKHTNVNVNAYFETQGTALYLAVKKKSFLVCKKLLEHPDIDPNIGKILKSPLYIAIEKGTTEIVELLLQHPRIEVNNIIDEYDHSAFYTACYHKKHDECLLLANHENFKPTLSDIKKLCKVKYVDVACVLAKKNLLNDNDIIDNEFKEQITQYLKVLSSKSARK